MIFFASCKSIFVIAADADLAVIVDVDLNAGALDDLVDDLALLADNITDLFGIDLREDDLRSILADFLAGLGNCRGHDSLHDILAGILASLDSTFDDRSCQAMDLDIHLDGGDAVVCTGNLEVHVAEEIFETLDIGQQDKIVIGLARDKAAADAGNLLLDRNACCHKSHAGCAGRTHGSGSVGFKSLGYGTDGIREFLDRRKNRNKRFLSKCAMSDLTTAGASRNLGLADGICREIVLMDTYLLLVMLGSRVPPPSAYRKAEPG
jgi:hypothetical protein